MRGAWSLQVLLGGSEGRPPKHGAVEERHNCEAGSLPWTGKIVLDVFRIQPVIQCVLGLGFVMRS